MSKRIISLLLCIVMMTSVLASCSKNNSHNHKTSESTAEQQQGTTHDHTHNETKPSEGTTEEPEQHTHIHAAAVRENLVDSTCTATGSYDEVVYCSTCNEEISRTEKTVEKKAHDYTQKVTTSTYLKTSATETGSAEYYYSCKCGAKGTSTFTDGSPLPHTHNFNQTVATADYLKDEATCKSKAVYYYS